ncbi:hypothetical protein [Streptomyces sp. SAI-127]|uniref:hypothetical protein n=1 Tax=Streptomyces sp. SAI-127 TaxID=2940543 RepID=UPI00247380BA|nr:hypothetical protein [Streptomyces sp. SAI-127]MDH6485540.1 hypothetical protein [Streptomyces sp. SAI-127]
MRAIRVASAALLGMAALSFSAPAAVAKDTDITPFGFSVLPSTVAAGGQVALLLERNHGGCRGSATVTSEVLDTVIIPPHKSYATAVVDWDARPGSVYRVTFTCDGVSGSTRVTIAGGRPDGPTPVPLHPDRGVHAGGGGSIAGFDLKELGMGAALITGSIGAAYNFSRRHAGEDEA